MAGKPRYPYSAIAARYDLVCQYLEWHYHDAPKLTSSHLGRYLCRPLTPLFICIATCLPRHATTITSESSATRRYIFLLLTDSRCVCRIAVLLYYHVKRIIRDPALGIKEPLRRELNIPVDYEDVVVERGGGPGGEPRTKDGSGGGAADATAAGGEDVGEERRHKGRLGVGVGMGVVAVVAVCVDVGVGVEVGAGTSPWTEDVVVERGGGSSVGVEAGTKGGSSGGAADAAAAGGWVGGGGGAGCWAQGPRGWW